VGIIRVLIIHRSRLFRESLAFVVGALVSMVRTAADVSAIEKELDCFKPDIVLLDINVTDRDGPEEARRIRALSPETKVVMIGPQLKGDIIACVRADAASGFLHENSSLEELINTTKAVIAGDVVYPPQMVSLLMAELKNGAHGKVQPPQLNGIHLTGRELGIIALIDAGLSNKEIAARLAIEVQTVKNHVHNILDKLQLDGRREAARYARQQGWVPC
jgi:DNA-binding NarL/FixJ family response regulator